jgi:hypothetical protein
MGAKGGGVSEGIGLAASYIVPVYTKPFQAHEG